MCDVPTLARPPQMSYVRSMLTPGTFSESKPQPLNQTWMQPCSLLRKLARNNVRCVIPCLHSDFLPARANRAILLPEQRSVWLRPEWQPVQRAMSHACKTLHAIIPQPSWLSQLTFLLLAERVMVQASGKKVISTLAARPISP